MKIIASKSAASWALVFVALGASGLARADLYTIILKDGGPCVTYTFDADPTTEGTQSVVLDNPSAVGGPCVVGNPPPAFPTSFAATVDVVPYAETEQGGPSRITNLDGGPTDQLSITGSNQTWRFTGVQGQPLTGTYFIYNTNSVPSPAALSLLLLGGAGMLSARLLSRRGKK